MPNRLTNAALAGLLSGLVACGSDDSTAAAEKTADQAAAKAEAHDATHGATKQATAYTGNSCAGQNVCKGLGGCKTDKHACKGMNDCKGQGGCHISGEEQTRFAAKMKESAIQEAAH